VARTHALQQQRSHGQSGRGGSRAGVAPRGGVRSLAATPQEWALQIQRTAGNRALQRIIIDPTKTPEEVKKGKKKSFHDRPSEPYREVPLPATVFAGVKVDQSRHHIIPWNTLSAFVRAAYQAGHAAELNRVLSGAMMTMMENSPRYREGVRGEVPVNQRGGTRMQGDLTLADLRSELRKKPSGKPNSAAVEAIATAYCWMPGNLFLGPLNELRLDDPDEDFEQYAEEQVGPRLSKYKKAFDDIKEYVNGPTQEVANRIANFLQSVAAKREPFKFDERVWLRVEDEDGVGRFYLRKAENSSQVQKGLASIKAAQRLKFAQMVEERNAWHKSMQEVWAQQHEASKAKAKV
jgi:hypothetical protein